MALKINPNTPAQTSAQSYGQYCLASLTPEWRAWAEDASVDWLKGQILYYEDDESDEADILRTAYMEILDPT